MCGPEILHGISVMSKNLNLSIAAFSGLAVILGYAAASGKVAKPSGVAASVTSVTGDDVAASNQAANAVGRRAACYASPTRET